MNMVRKLFAPTVRADLKEARREELEARETLMKKLKEASERGVTVSLSRDALERIARFEPAR